MSAVVAEQLPLPPSPLPAELVTDVARHRVDGRAWDAVGAAVRYDPAALRRACAADPRYAAARTAAEVEAEYEGEQRALRRLEKLTESDNERVAIRAAELLVRHARDRRRERAEPTAPDAPKAVEAKASPRPPAPAPSVLNPKSKVAAFRAIPDLPAARLAELLKGG